MTTAAQAFVTPLTFQAVSGEPVYRDLLDETAEAAMGHIELARWADTVLVAPATANVMARLAHGFADDLLTTVCIATPAPIVIAPAMNQRMWGAPATRANLEILLGRGVRAIGPDAGDQACGDVGPGRMSEPADIVSALLESVRSTGEGPGAALPAPPDPLVPDAGGFVGPAPPRPVPRGGAAAPKPLGGTLGHESAPLAGVRVLVTAGPTREPIDPVRFISNHSSGKMGFAVAAAARGAGAEVNLVSGPVSIAPPAGVRIASVGSAAEMHREVMSRVASCEIFIGTAAVADYTPATPAREKLKKDNAPRRIELQPTPDILAEVAALEEPPFTVGFAAETGDLEAHAREKLERKRLDLIAANLVGVPDRGFESERNALLVLWPGGGRAELPVGPKTLLAAQLVTLLAERYRAKCPAPPA